MTFDLKKKEDSVIDLIFVHPAFSFQNSEEMDADVLINYN